MKFEDFYQSVHGYCPRQWQNDLADSVKKENRWNENISAPTGAGKTSVLDVAVWHLATQILDGEERTAPLRIVLSVERKLIIDQANEHAQKILYAIDNNEDLVHIKEALRSLLPHEERDNFDIPTINIVSMHSDSSWDKMWWKPVGCSIITGTVTQIASRTLYNGVGESTGMRSISAGVLGSDCIRFMDEAHLTIPAIRALKEQGQMVRNRAPQTVMLGATIPPSLRTEDKFIANIPQRVHGRKLTLIEHEKDTDVIKYIAQEAKSSHEKYDGEVVVIVSTTHLARKVAKAIKGVPTQVITSQVRPYDRNNIGSLPKKDAIIIATQTLEVGVDYDASVIISDLAPLPTLIQRAGRAGRKDTRDSEVIVVANKEISAGAKFIYGEDALVNTFKVISSGLDSLDDINISDSQYDETWTKEPRTVELESKMADLLSDTQSSSPWECFVYGAENKDSPQVNVAWRKNPELAGIIPPDSQECITIPIQSIRGALIGKDDSDKLSDIDTSLGNVKFSKNEIVVDSYILKRQNDSNFVEKIENIWQIKPGDTVILSVNSGLYSVETGWDTTFSKGVSIHKNKEVEDISSIIGNRRITNYGTKILHDPELLIGTKEYNDHINGIEEYELENGFLWSHGGKIITQIISEEDNSNNIKNDVVTLADHSLQVAEFAKDCAQLTSSFMNPEDFYIAGIHHDLGKIIPEFQKNVLGNIDYDGSVPLAKSTGIDNSMTNAIIQSHGDKLPSPWRHETIIAHMLNKAGYKNSSYLVADHHGKGVVHKMGDDEFYSVTTKDESLSPWDYSLCSAIFRYADWVCSANPEKFGFTMDDVKESLVITTDFSYKPEPIITNDKDKIIHLTGLNTKTHSDVMAAYGAFAATLNKDPNSLIRFHNGEAQIYTSSEIEWSPIGEGFEILQNHYLEGNYPTYISQDYWELKEVSEYIKNSEGNKTDKKRKVKKNSLASQLLHNNSYPGKYALEDNISTNVLFDESIGWGIKTPGSGMDSYISESERQFTQSYRADIYAWALKGQLSWGAPTGKYGAGSDEDSICVPYHDSWMNFQEVQARARRGYGRIYKYTKITDYQLCWVRIS